MFCNFNAKVQSWQALLEQQTYPHEQEKLFESARGRDGEQRRHVANAEK